MSIFQIEDNRNYLYQWDKDRKLIINSTDTKISEVHFSYSTTDEAITEYIKTDNGIRYVDIQNSLLENYGFLKIYAYGQNHTQYFGQIEVRKRAKPDNYVPNEENRRAWKDIYDETIMTNIRVDNLEDSLDPKYINTKEYTTKSITVPINACPFVQINKISTNITKLTSKNSLQEDAETIDVFTISGELTEESFIKVAGGGVIEIETTHESDIKITLTFLLKEV